MCVQGVYVRKCPLSMGTLVGYLVNVVGRTVLGGTVVLNQDLISLSRNRTCQPTRGWRLEAKFPDYNPPLELRTEKAVAPHSSTLA